MDSLDLCALWSTTSPGHPGTRGSV